MTMTGTSMMARNRIFFIFAFNSVGVVDSIQILTLSISNVKYALKTISRFFSTYVITIATFGAPVVESSARAIRVAILA